MAKADNMFLIFPNGRAVFAFNFAFDDEALIVDMRTTSDTSERWDLLCRIDSVTVGDYAKSLTIGPEFNSPQTEIQKSQSRHFRYWHFTCDKSF